LDPYSGVVNGKYLQELRTLKTQLESGRAALIYCNQIKWRFYYYPNEEELTARLQMRPAISVVDGAIYGSFSRDGRRLPPNDRPAGHEK
jgi:hypothetical protein